MHIRVTETSGVQKAFISKDEKEWTSMVDFYGIRGDYDLRFTTTLSDIFADFLESAKDLPATWYPALIRTFIEASLKKEIWQNTSKGLLVFINNVIEEIDK